MPDRPLLILPGLGPPVARVKRPAVVIDTYHLPSRGDQARRFAPQFNTMLEAFVTDSPAGIATENVLVLETTGKIDEFRAAVSAVPGLKWLAEIDLDDMESDDQFFDRPKIGPRFFKDKGLSIDTRDSRELYEALKRQNLLDKNDFLYGNVTTEQISNAVPSRFVAHAQSVAETIDQEKRKPLSGRMYLSASNRQALQRLKALFDEWYETGVLPHGSGPWKSIFSHLRALRFWSVEDRIRDTGILQYLRQEVDLKKGTSSKILFEIELHYSESEKDRGRRQKEVADLVRMEQGSVTAFCHIPEIKFHALKAELPVSNLERVLSNDYSRLFESHNVYFFRPSVQCITEVPLEGTKEDIAETWQRELPPVIALLDGYPLANHRLLAGFLSIDDPDGFGESYQPNEQYHGTAMASLICHSELDASDQPLKRTIYVRPILKPVDDYYKSPRPEKVPKDVFFEDVLERAVRRIFDGDRAGTPPAAPTVRVINLSIADPDRMFNALPCPTARLLDWLSFKYRVLFCVSAGNINGPLRLGVNKDHFDALSEEEKVSLTLSVISSNKRNRRILAPSESINAITVGALHNDMSGSFKPGPRIDILPSRQVPSPVSSLGHGFRSAIKPDVLFPGGRLLYTFDGEGVYSPDQLPVPPGQKTAGPAVNPGDLNRVIYVRGTSNATAIASRNAGIIYDAIESLYEDYSAIDGFEFPRDRIAPLLKALLVHGACWGDSKQILETALRLDGDARQIKKEIARYLGYGIPEVRKSIECSFHRATAISCNTIEKDERHEYRFPLPSSLSGSSAWRRLTLTLAWLSPISLDNRKYRRAALSFEASGLDREIGGVRHEAWYQSVRNGTVQHEIIEGEKVVMHQEGDALVVPVQCREEAGPLDVPIPYGLAISLEVKEEIEIPIYDEVRAGIEIALREQIAERVR